jgi:hypothetical protein
MKVGLQWELDGDMKSAKIGALCLDLKEQGLGCAEALKVSLEKLDACVVDRLCGKRYSRSHEHAFRRSGTRFRYLRTSIGDVVVKLTRVQNVASGRHSMPLFDIIKVARGRNIQLDLQEIITETALEVSLRGVGRTLGRLIDSPPAASTVHAMIRQRGGEVARAVMSRPLKARCVMPDGTKLKAQCHNKSSLEVHASIVLGLDGKPKLRSVSVERPWIYHTMAIRRTEGIDDLGNTTRLAFVSDMEPGLRSLANSTGTQWQSCHIHLPRALENAMRADCVPGYSRVKIQKKAGVLLWLLRVNLEEGMETSAAINEFRHACDKLIRRLRRHKCRRGANIVENYFESMVTFASARDRNHTIPWSNNHIERVMGMIASRCKHGWASWSAEGAEALIALLLLKNIEPDTYRDMSRHKAYGRAGSATIRNVSRWGVKSEC